MSENDADCAWRVGLKAGRAPLNNGGQKKWLVRKF